MKNLNQRNHEKLAANYHQGWQKALKEYSKYILEKNRKGGGKNILLFCLIIFINSFSSNAQQIVQTVRGKIVDQEAQMPIIGATIVLLGSEPLKGTSSGVNGEFVINGVAVGRHTFKVSSIGYEDVILPEIEVISGKETVLNLQLRESLTQLNEIVIKAGQEKGEPINEMAVVSARSFTVEETQRYAASVNDPARMALSFAGVSNGDDGTNDIIVRGNSPRGVLWRVQGIEIPNPNHFGEEGSSGGGITMLSANMLSTSDFYTGAFPAEYGNGYSAVFDLNLRKGNNQKKEYAAQAGLLGVDFAFEGPFNKNYQGSYLVNYRYSTLAILDQLGLGNLGGAVPNFQDLSYHINLPTKRLGTFSIWGIGGLSHENYSDEEANFKYYYNMGVGGITHRIFLNDQSYLESTVSASKSANGFEGIRFEDNLVYEDKFINSVVRGSVMYNNKISSRHTIRAGAIASYKSFDLLQQYTDVDTSALEADATGNTMLYQGYAQWKSRLNERLTMNIGFHTMLLALNNKGTIEPRFGVNYELTPNSSLSFGYGQHSKQEALAVYFSRYGEEGSLPNKNMDFMKAHHYVVGYENMLKADLRLKVEAYYQKINDVPVAASGTTDQEWLTYSLLNYNGGLVNHPLVNNGEGKNYGLEMTLEKSFTDGYYFTLTGSLYNSKYTGSDGLERDTRYNGNYTSNLMIGREYKVGKKDNNILGIGLRTLSAGGNRWTPILLEESIEKDEEVYDWSKRYQIDEGIYFRTDLRVSFRKNKEKYSSIWSLDIQNVTNHQNLWGQHYDTDDQEVVKVYQMSLLPVLSYKIEF